MATIGETVLTLADWAKRLDPDGRVETVVEMLSQTNEILADMLWLEGNLPTGHRTTVRTGLPSVAWRKLNYGVPQSKSTTVQVTDSCGMLEAFSTVDKDLADLNGNTAGFRLSEAQAFVEAMNQTMADTLFYGDTARYPERFLGLSPRFDDDTTAETRENIVDAGGSSTDNTSVWLVCWGANTVHGIFPRGSMAGIQHKDLGVDTVTDTEGNPYLAYRDHWQWKCGLTVRDWRYVVRIANIDVSNLVGETSAADLLKLMVKAVHKLPSTSMGRCAFHMNRTVRTMLDIQAMEKSNVNLTIERPGGKPQTEFWGIPLRTCDSILNTEAAVS